MSTVEAMIMIKNGKFRLKVMSFNHGIKAGRRKT